MIVSKLNGFSSTQRFETANLTGPLANTTGFSVWAIVLPNINAVNQFIFGKTTSISGITGWGLVASLGGYALQIGDGTTSKMSPKVGVALGEENKIQILHGVVRSGQMYMYKNGFRADGFTSISSIGSYTGPMRFGSFSGGTNYQSSIIAIGICDTHGLSDEEVESHYQSLLLDITSTPINATYHWVAEDAGSTWVDRISSLSATRTGTLTPSSADHNFFLPRFIDTDYTWSVSPISPPISNTLGLMNVLPTGDSRTAGAGGSNSNAWRNGVSLLKNATSDMNEVDFVGMQSSTAIDPQHNGHSGSDNRDHLYVLNDITVSPATIMSTYNPSVIIHWLGVNGSADDVEIVDEKAAYLDLLRAYHAANNNVRFVLLDEATITEAPRNARLEEFRLWQRYTAWPQLISEGLKIITCYNPLKPSLGHYADPLHPNDSGYEALANAIYPALRLALGVDYVEPTIIPRIFGMTKITGATKLIF